MQSVSVHRRPSILVLHGVREKDLADEFLPDNKFTESLINNPTSAATNNEPDETSLAMNTSTKTIDIIDQRWMDLLSEDAGKQQNIDPLGNLADLSYVALPATFTSLATWPLKTNLLCWACHRPFKSRPIFIPDAVEKVETHNNSAKAYKMKTYGCFCRWSCAQNYIDREYVGTAHDDRSKHLLMLHFIFTGKRALVIRGAPSTTERKKYRGETGLSDQQYQKKLDEFDMENIVLL